jgi:hypothetical protein
MKERAERQAAMRDRLNAEEERQELFTLIQAAKLLNVSRSTAWRLLKDEIGVNLIKTPGSKRPSGSVGPYSGDWNQEGVILFVKDIYLFRVPAAGGTPSPVTELDKSRAGHLRRRQ